MITGRCECGKVKFEANDEINDYSHCHCSQCRRLHGAAFASFGGIDFGKLNFTCGKDEIRQYASSPGSQRYFCGNCGSSLLVTVDSEPDAAYLAMGVIDGNPACPSGYHQFVGSKAPWYDINDDLPRYELSIDDE